MQIGHQNIKTEVLRPVLDSRDIISHPLTSQRGRSINVDAEVKERVHQHPINEDLAVAWCEVRVEARKGKHQ
ncbi:hypothetical protein Daesc_000268 [Daldinia eschscholtzii]|uniref:Uncharacterized protein n=1 Tax=Daldinia eschscholtzii TaxID=292717 RepID=A0AAX6MZ80_9PEZI